MRLKNFSHEELKKILNELEQEEKIKSKRSSKSTSNSLLYQARR